MQYYFAVKCSKAGPECSSIKQYKKPQCNRARVIDAEAHRHHLLPYLQLSFEKLCRNLHPYYNYLFQGDCDGAVHWGEPFQPIGRPGKQLWAR